MGEVLGKLQKEGKLEVSQVPGAKPTIPYAFYISRNESDRIIIKLKK